MYTTYRYVLYSKATATEINQVYKNPGIGACDILGEVAAVGVSKDGSMGILGREN